MFRALMAAPLLLAGTACHGTPVGNRVEVNGMQMYYEVSGAGDPLIVLHGAYMNIPTMGAIIPKLARTHKVYALEFQGHGRTTDIDRPITYPNLADDVAAFMEAVGVHGLHPADDGGDVRRDAVRCGVSEVRRQPRRLSGVGREADRTGERADGVGA